MARQSTFTPVHSSSLWFTPFHPRQTFLHYHSFTLVHPISFYLTHLHSFSSHFTLASRRSRVKLSGPLYPNVPSALFCTFPRLASPTSSTYPVGCLSPMQVKLIKLTMSAATEGLCLVCLSIHTQR